MGSSRDWFDCITTVRELSSPAHGIVALLSQDLLSGRTWTYRTNALLLPAHDRLLQDPALHPAPGERVSDPRPYGHKVQKASPAGGGSGNRLNLRGREPSRFRTPTGSPSLRTTIPDPLLRTVGHIARQKCLAEKREARKMGSSLSTESKEGKT
jgi:hypothetical protein